jgi:hypothetical protein
MQVRCTLRRGAGDHDPPHQPRPQQRELLGDEAAEGEPEKIDLAEPEHVDEPEDVAGHVGHVVRHGPG